MAAKILLTLAEEQDRTTETQFAVRYAVDEEDCFDFAQGLKELGHEVYFANWNDLKETRFDRIFSFNKKSFARAHELSEFNLTFIYKMEGFYFDPERFSAMVRSIARNCRVVVNDPRTIAHNIDKRYLWDLKRFGIPIIPTTLVTDPVLSELKNGKQFVFKPMRGERGNGIVLARRQADIEPIKDKLHEYLAQEFMPEIRDGERSLVYLGTEFQHAVLKKPSQENKDEFRCNESLGGTVQVYQPNPEELDVAAKILRAYEDMGLPVHFSRIDLIKTERGPLLVEAELLNPSIYANYSKRGPEFGHAIALYFDGLLRRAVRGEQLIQVI